MPGLADFLSFLRLLIARGDPEAIPSATSAITTIWRGAISAAARPAHVAEDARELHDAGVGVQRSFAETWTIISSGG